MSMIKEFKDFTMRGNVLDMAVGIIIGAAFGSIVKSLVDNLITPPIGLLLGGVDFSALAVVLSPAVGDKPAVVLGYGIFIQRIIDFVIIAFAIFMMIKGANSFRRKSEEAPAAPPEPGPEEKLLTEIRDLLKSKS